MDVFAYEDYREILRARVKELGQIRRGVTMKRMSEKIGIQYTYLSKALNHPKTHLSGDHLFVACRFLEFFPEETDYIELLHSHATAAAPARRDSLRARIDRARKAKRKSVAGDGMNTGHLSQEMAYLFDPECLLVHLGLHIEGYFRAPKKLAQALGIDPERMEFILKKLKEIGFVDLSEDGRVLKLQRQHIHYQTDHPLMRVHQNLLRSLCIPQLMRLPESDKHSTTVTFTSDRATFEKVREMFVEFLEKAERRVVSSKDEQMFQLNFDLFRWV